MEYLLKLMYMLLISGLIALRLMSLRTKREDDQKSNRSITADMPDSKISQTVDPKEHYRTKNNP